MVMLGRLFQSAVRELPQKVAVRCGSLVVTYSELSARAQRIARFVRTERVDLEECVAL
jgi:non-ribosomal peptide synthetase component F